MQCLGSADPDIIVISAMLLPTQAIPTPLNVSKKNLEYFSVVGRMTPPVTPPVPELTPMLHHLWCSPG